ncbi:MAG: deoxyribodipyrimidine photolyase [Acidobacteria bacterium]|nr:deoxyribodipyrimidine photolyase [Acidobacteriota bacterium]
MGMGYVLYRARTSRRVEGNRALNEAVRLANQAGLPVLFYEELPCGAPYASDRLHTFALEGVPETARRLEQMGIGYVFYLPRRRSDPQSLVDRLAACAAEVVTDRDPLVPAAPNRQVDSSCIVPMDLIAKREYAAYSIRPKIRKLLPKYLKPLEIPRVATRWQGRLPQHTEVIAERIPGLVAECEIDHSVAPVRGIRGGRAAALQKLAAFLDQGLRNYARERNNPAAHSTSGLSPYLRWGFIGALEVALAVREYAERHKLIAEEFLEELMVRRELAYNFACHAPPPYTLHSLPGWARQSIDEHRADHREPVYSPEQFERALTHDPLWNAAQQELRKRGRIHGYYRMYWGKKIIEWSATPEQALSTMIHLNDRYALDGLNPNGYANILWCFGLHDRPWPERPVFGKVRYMSFDGMRRKTAVEAYIQEVEALP